jgi:hypothetical protein
VSLDIYIHVYIYNMLFWFWSNLCKYITCQDFISPEPISTYITPKFKTIILLPFPCGVRWFKNKSILFQIKRRNKMIPLSQNDVTGAQHWTIRASSQCIFLQRGVPKGNIWCIYYLSGLVISISFGGSNNIQSKRGENLEG